jgi:hypothetical protein
MSPGAIRLASRISTATKHVARSYPGIFRCAAYARDGTRIAKLRHGDPP